SASVAVLVITIGACPRDTRFAWVGRTGALFTSRTKTVKVFVALSCALSVTIVVKTLVPGPCASEGIQVIMPFPLIVAPAGGLTRRYVKTETVVFVEIMSSRCKPQTGKPLVQATGDPPIQTPRRGLTNATFCEPSEFQVVPF